MRAIVFDKEKATVGFSTYSDGEDHILGFHMLKVELMPGDVVKDGDVEDEPFFGLVFRNPKGICATIKALDSLYKRATGQIEQLEDNI